MEKIGLSDELRVELLAKVNLIGFGRKALYTPNQSEKGRELYTEGISGAFAIFQEVHIIKAPATFIQAEFVFVTQELNFCDESEKLTIASLQQAISQFTDAMKALAIVEQPLIYQGAADTYPNDKKYRVQGMPKDAFHIACNAHYTRLMNSLHTPGLSPEERALYQIRAENMKAAISAYIEKQKAALSC